MSSRYGHAPANPLASSPQARVGHPGLAVVQQRVAVRRPAAAPRIRRIRVADKQLGTVDYHRVASFHKGICEGSTGGHPGQGIARSVAAAER